MDHTEALRYDVVERLQRKGNKMSRETVIGISVIRWSEGAHVH